MRCNLSQLRDFLQSFKLNRSPAHERLILLLLLDYGICSDVPFIDTLCLSNSLNETLVLQLCSIETSTWWVLAASSQQCWESRSYFKWKFSLNLLRNVRKVERYRWAFAVKWTLPKFNSIYINPTTISIGKMPNNFFPLFYFAFVCSKIPSKSLLS